MNDRTLNLLRHVVVPVAIAAVSGYWAMRAAREQTRASYEALSPVVRELQDDVAKLSGRVDELSRQAHVIVMREDKPRAMAAAPMPVKLPTVQVEVDKTAPAQQQMKRPAEKFDDMLKGL